MKRVLIVDDQAEVRELVRLTLELEQHEIHEAENGPSALRAVEAFQPDLVLLDVMMPGGMDGYAACESIRRAQPGRRSKPRVVMLTSRDRPQDEQRGRMAGADAYLVKPFSPRELLAVVHKLS